MKRQPALFQWDPEGKQVSLLSLELVQEHFLIFRTGRFMCNIIRWDFDHIITSWDFSCCNIFISCSWDIVAGSWHFTRYSDTHFQAHSTLFAFVSLRQNMNLHILTTSTNIVILQNAQAFDLTDLCTRKEMAKSRQLIARLPNFYHQQSLIHHCQWYWMDPEVTIFNDGVSGWLCVPTTLCPMQVKNMNLWYEVLADPKNKEG